MLNPAMSHSAPGGRRASGAQGAPGAPASPSVAAAAQYRTGRGPGTRTWPPAGADVRADVRADCCDLVTVPARQGLEAVDILRRGHAEAVGPVLHDGTCDTLGFLVPPGTADGWDLPGSACTQTLGRGLAHETAPPVAGTGWLLPPDDTDHVTDPGVLRAALGEAARIIEAADNCR